MTTLVADSLGKATPDAEHSGWRYQEAFKRNLGLVTPAEQEKLRNSRVAIAGMGGVGGVHLTTLARLGIGKFTIADYDTFEVANFNRQQGARISNIGRNKAEAMAEEALDINPELDIHVMQGKIDESNVGEFLDDVNLIADGLDFFAVEARRMLYRNAAERAIWSIMSGPIGFSAAWLVFDPNGMSLDRYFDFKNSMSDLEKVVAFGVGLTPSPTQLTYTDFSYASIDEKTGPSAGLACQLASGVLAADTLRILLRRGDPPAAPYYRQLDPYRGKLICRRLRYGNRGPFQRIKRWIYRKQFTP